MILVITLFAVLSYNTHTSVVCLNGNLIAANSRFNFFDTDLLRYAADDRNGNIVVSPASIKSTLAMILEGAGGETALEIRSALRLSPNIDEYREQLNLYLSVLKVNTTNTKLENANAVFISNKLKVRRSYLQMLQYVYLSSMYAMDFKNAAVSSNLINSWVRNRTHGQIPNIIEPVHIEQSTEILLVNALYFKSSWKNAFNPDLTKSGCFYVGGNCKNASLMELQAELNYAYVDNLRAHAVELPYMGGKYSMVILVPQDRDGCVGLLRDLPYMSLPQITELMDPTDVQLSLPRFTVDYSEDLVRVLQNMRIHTLFSSAANLSGIFDSVVSPQVSSIFHKTHIEVNEAGTIAAAATSAMVIPLISSGVQLKIDRPFVFFIRDNSIGAILFEGKITEPESFDKNINPGKNGKSLNPKRRYGK